MDNKRLSMVYWSVSVGLVLVYVGFVRSLSFVLILGLIISSVFPMIALIYKNKKLMVKSETKFYCPSCGEVVEKYTYKCPFCKEKIAASLYV